MRASLTDWHWRVVKLVIRTSRVWLYKNNGIMLLSWLVSRNYALPVHYYDIYLSIELLVFQLFKALYSSRLVGDG